MARDLVMVYARILQRYLAGILLGASIIPQWMADMIANDPQIAAGIAFVLIWAAEFAYAMAKKYGWKT